jgi:hypothetical protein
MIENFQFLMLYNLSFAMEFHRMKVWMLSVKGWKL